MAYLGFDHVSINVSDIKRSREFYDTFLPFLGFQKVKDNETSVRWSNGISSFSIKPTGEPYSKNAYHRKNPGLNHIAFKADSKTSVDEFCEKVLSPNNIQTLYNSPRIFPEYSDNYYAVFFEDPDRVKIELVSKQ